MAKAKNYIPDGFNTVSPYLVVDGAEAFIDFITKGFGGEPAFVMRSDDKITHATIKVGNSTIMAGDTMRGMEAQTAMLYLYVEDADTVFKKAIEAGAEVFSEVKDEFYGDRSGAVKDRWGNIWWIATQIEDVSPDELSRRAEERDKKEKQEVPAH